MVIKKRQANNQFLHTNQSNGKIRRKRDSRKTLQNQRYDPIRRNYS